MSDVTVAPDAAPDMAPPAETPPEKSPHEIAAARTQRSVFRKDSENPAKALPIVPGDDNDAYEALEQGARFQDDKGTKFVKPYTVKSDQDYADVPEGKEFIDGSGNKFKKPVAEPLNFSEQTLYDMAPSSSKRKVLEKFNPGKVKEDLEGLYIDEGEGKLRRPGGQRGARAFAGSLAAEVLPVAGAAGGGLAGGAFGGLPGALGGAALGGAAGQGLNDSILALAGIHPESAGQEALRLGGAGAMGALGEGAGRMVGGVVPTVREGISNLTEKGIPWALKKGLTGTATTEEEMVLAEKLTKQGYPVPGSVAFKGAPRLQNAIDRFRERYNLGAMRSELEPYYEKEATSILDKLGVKTAEGEKILNPTESVGTEATGKALQDRAIGELANADAKLDADIAAKRVGAVTKAETTSATKSDVLKTAEESRVAAQKVVDESFANVRRDVDNAFKLAEAGHKGGDLFQLVADKFRALRTGFGERANYWYERFDEMTGGATVTSEHLASTAQKMLDELPAEFKSRNPALVQKLAKLAPQHDMEGNLVRPAEAVSYGELQKLRTLFRGSADWQTLSGDFKNGQLKFFSNEINRLIHDPSAPEQVKKSAKFLDMIDGWYGHNIKLYDSEVIKSLQKGIASGEPADPKVIRDILLKEGHSDLIKRTFDMMGPTLANAVRAADLDVMLQNSKTHVPGQIDGVRFYDQVVSRYRNGLLQATHGEEVTNKLLKQAEHLKMLEGKLPVKVEPGDRIADVIAKSRAAKAAADDLSKTDPLKTLAQEMKGIDAEYKKRLKERINDEQLGFLYDSTYGAIKSVDRILSSPDLILAAEGKFGATSPEFNMLRQIYTKRLLQSGDAASALEKVPDRVQRTMFALAYDDMKLLAKEWKIISESGAFKPEIASGMMTQSRVENPVGKIGGVAARFVPGTKMAANAVWSSYYEWMTKITAKNHWLMVKLLQGLRNGGEEKEQVREILRKHAQKYGAMGAAAGEAVYQGSGE